MWLNIVSEMEIQPSKLLPLALVALAPMLQPLRDRQGRDGLETSATTWRCCCCSWQVKSRAMEAFQGRDHNFA